jgi:hypothetical protein
MHHTRFLITVGGSAVIASVSLGVHLASAATVVEVTGIWTTTLLDNTTAFGDGTYIGPTNGSAADVDNGRVTYDFSATPFVNHAGAEFYVYESAGGNAEFMDIDVLVSGDGTNFTSVKTTEGAPVAYALPGGLVPRLSGDTIFSNAGYLVGAKVKAYDLGGMPGDYVGRYVRVQGNVTEPNSGGFDLDAVGLITGIPEPAMLSVLALSGISVLCRRR